MGSFNKAQGEFENILINIFRQNPETLSVSNKRYRFPPLSEPGFQFPWQ